MDTIRHQEDTGQQIEQIPASYKSENDEENLNHNTNSTSNHIQLEFRRDNSCIEINSENTSLSCDHENEESCINCKSTDYHPSGRFDVNVYQQKKTLAQGMMDLALLSANANQLRYLFEHPKDSRDGFFYTSLVFIMLSIILQVSVGIGLIWNGQYDVKKEDHCHKANQANNITVIGIFLITILNVFITAFGVPSSTQTVAIPIKNYNLDEAEGNFIVLNETIT